MFALWRVLSRIACADTACTAWPGGSPFVLLRRTLRSGYAVRLSEYCITLAKGVAIASVARRAKGEGCSFDYVSCQALLVWSGSRPHVAVIIVQNQKQTNTRTQLVFPMYRIHCRTYHWWYDVDKYRISRLLVNCGRKERTNRLAKATAANEITYDYY